MLLNKTNHLSGDDEPELGPELPALLLQYAFDPAEFARVVLGWTLTRNKPPSCARRRGG